MIRFVISAENTISLKERFFAIDNESGGFPYWTPFLNNAVFFTSEEAAQRVIDGLPEQKESEQYPCSVLHTALEINCAHPSGEVTLQVLEVKLQPSYTKTFKGTIRK